MKVKITFIGLLLLVTTMCFGQSSVNRTKNDLKNNTTKPVNSLPAKDRKTAAKDDYRWGDQWGINSKNQSICKNGMVKLVEESRQYYKTGQKLEEFVKAVGFDYATLKSEDQTLIKQIYNYLLTNTSNENIIKTYDGSSIKKVFFNDAVDVTTEKISLQVCVGAPCFRCQGPGCLGDMPKIDEKIKK